MFDSAVGSTPHNDQFVVQYDETQSSHNKDNDHNHNDFTPFIGVASFIRNGIDFIHDIHDIDTSDQPPEQFDAVRRALHH